jgi:hypothetical protein
MRSNGYEHSVVNNGKGLDDGEWEKEKQELIDFKELPRGVSESRPCINAYHVDLSLTQACETVLIVYTRKRRRER